MTKLNIDVLIVGSNEAHCIESFYNKHLNELNLKTQIFNMSDYFSLTILNRVRNRIGDTSFYKNLNKALIEYCQFNKPKIIWIFKGLELYAKTISILKQTNAILVNYNPDHPFIRTFVSSGGKNIENSVPLYDFHFSYSKEVCKKITQEYNIPTAWLPFGYELSQQQYVKAQTQDKINKICFLGNPDQYRVAHIKALAKAGETIHVYGHNWNRWLKNSEKIVLNDAVYGEEFWQKLAAYKIQLNVFRPHNYGSHNMRTFEIPAIGGIQLAPHSMEHEIFFEDNKQIFLYKNEKELIEKAKFILQLNNSDTNEIGLSARKKSLDNKYSYRERSIEVKNIFQTLISKKQ